MESTPPRSEVVAPIDTLLNNVFNPEKVVAEPIDLTAYEGKNKFCVLLHNILSPQECTNLINWSESKTYEVAKINVGFGREKLMTDIRNNDRCIVDSPAVVEQIWQRILLSMNLSKPHNGELLNSLLHVPFVGGNQARNSRSEPCSWNAVGLNERMRFLRYDPGTYFAPHNDGCYMRGLEAGRERKGEVSFVTLQLYLNEGFEGGATRFLSHNYEDVGFDVVPQVGSVLLFQHDCYHEGALLKTGRKYAVRTDVMYSNKGPGWEYSAQPLLPNH
mmetsp:Transcript_1451/g.2376  ORF Transcript_1451/g.2376 Transcript_1451/m.2376 type:complete len:274 (+) Transcript_1451:42-863(+)